VEIWRKRQCYIWIARYVLEQGNYNAYYNFLWEDHVQRERLIKTFNMRHAPLTDGSNKSTFARTFVPAEPGWDEDGDDSDVNSDIPASGPSHDASGPSHTELEWDSDNETWVHPYTGTHRAPHPAQHTHTWYTTGTAVPSSKKKNPAVAAALPASALLNSEPEEDMPVRKRSKKKKRRRAAMSPASAAPNSDNDPVPKRRKSHARTKPRAVRSSPRKKK